MLSFSWAELWRSGLLPPQPWPWLPVGLGRSRCKLYPSNPSTPAWSCPRWCSSALAVRWRPMSAKQITVQPMPSWISCLNFNGLRWMELPWCGVRWVASVCVGRPLHLKTFWMMCLTPCWALRSVARSCTASPCISSPRSGSAAKNSMIKPGKATCGRRLGRSNWTSPNLPQSWRCRTTRRCRACPTWIAGRSPGTSQSRPWEVGPVWCQKEPR